MKNINTILLIIVILTAASLRLWHLSDNPPALYWDEASLGYNAYSILKTARDEHGEFLPITRFIAFGDYKPPGYIYATVPFIWLLGLNEFSIRFASALAGILSVVITYFLAKELFVKFDDKQKEKISILSALLLAINPWHIQFSRGAFEANLATFFSLCGLFFFLKGLNKKIFLNLSAIFFVASMYTFNTHRVFVPFMVIVLSAIYWEKLFKNKKILIAPVILGLILVVPLIPHFLTREGQLRFQEVTIFHDLEPVVRANQRIEREGNTLFARIVHNRRIQFASEFLNHFADHFNFNYLFFSGDVNPRLGTRDNGILYPIELPFIITGIYWLINKKIPEIRVLLLWWLVGLIPASTARETPHALRTLNVLPIPQILAATGALAIYQFVRLKRLYIFLVISFYLLLTTNFIHTYFVHYPKYWAASWQYGYKQMVEKISNLQSKYDKVFITGKYGRPYIYMLLYQKYSPEKYWQTRDTERDWFGFWTVSGFDKYRFGDVPPLDERNSDKWLMVTGPSGLPQGTDHISSIKFPNGETVFEIGDLK